MASEETYTRPSHGFQSDLSPIRLEDWPRALPPARRQRLGVIFCQFPDASVFGLKPGLSLKT